MRVPRGALRLVAATLAGIVLGVGLLVASLWSEAVAPGDAVDATAFDRARATLTAPVAGAVGERVRRHVRTAAQRRLDLTGLSLEETIRRARDPSLSLEERGRCAVRLARSGSREAIDALIALFRDAPPEHRAFLAQLLGSTGDPAVAPYLEPLLGDPDPDVVLAAVRGLCALEGHDATELLAPLLWDVERPAAVRAEVARGLGLLGTENARHVLTDMLDRSPGSELRGHVLDGLGQFPFRRVSDTFRGVLRGGAASTTTRVAAAEALFHSDDEARPLLVDVAAEDPSPDVRASAAWALSGHDGAAGTGRKLADLAVIETEADVRRRLYEASLPQPDIPAERLVPLVRAETDVAARVAGANAIGQAVGRERAGEAATTFDTELVPELTRIATNENSLNIRLRAVFALRRARTDAARAALEIIAATDTPEVAAAARHGLGREAP